MSHGVGIPDTGSPNPAMIFRVAAPRVYSPRDPGATHAASTRPGPGAGSPEIHEAECAVIVPLWVVPPNLRVLTTGPISATPPARRRTPSARPADSPSDRPA